MRVVIAGGGSAGHVNPALAVADALRRRDPLAEITLVGTAHGLETRLVPERGYPLATIPRVPLPRRPTPELLSLPTRVSAAVRAGEQVLRRTGAQVVVGVGGYVALPVYLAAKRRGVPILVHEQNARPGLANRVGARLTPHVAVTFPRTPLPHATYVGLPLRRAVAELDRPARRAEALAWFGLEDRPTLLVTGGSQGAQRINRAVLGAADAITAAGVQVLHHAGEHGYAETAEALAERPADAPPWVVLPFIDRMELGYAAADLAICRAGANTCVELAAVGLPAVYVPLPHGNGEQRLNAAPTIAAGGGVLVDDAALNPAWIATEVLPLVLDDARLAGMAKAASGLGRRDADERLADWALRIARPDGEPEPEREPAP